MTKNEKRRKTHNSLQNVTYKNLRDRVHEPRETRGCFRWFSNRKQILFYIPKPFFSWWWPFLNSVGILRFLSVHNCFLRWKCCHSLIYCSWCKQYFIRNYTSTFYIHIYKWIQKQSTSAYINRSPLLYLFPLGILCFLFILFSYKFFVLNWDGGTIFTE